MPGAILVLMINYYVLDIAGLLMAFFPNDTLMYGVCFLGTSYLFGSILHQLGAIIEANFLSESIFSVEDNVNKEAWRDPQLRTAYESVYKTAPNAAAADADDADAAAKALADMRAAGRQVFHYVQKEKRPERIIIFSAFYAMSRTLIVTTALSMVIMICAYGNDRRIVHITIIGLLLIGVFILQWREYDKRCLNEAYEIMKTGHASGAGGK